MKIKNLVSTSAMLIAGLSTDVFAQQTSFLMCTSCPVGTYSTGGTSKSCTSCPAGQYQNETGASSCKVCLAGQYSSTTGASSCTSCPAGTYSSSAASKSCALCPAGTFSSAGATSCTACPKGQYQNLTGQSSCTACTGNTYSSTAGATSCTKVPANTSQSCKTAPYSGNYWDYVFVCEVLLSFVGGVPGTGSLMATQIATLDFAGFLATASTPSGACYIGKGVFSLPRDGTQSVTYSVNSTHTGYTTSYGSCN
ncbi:MAG: hypothetical protein K6F04_02270 [bacterium]|nr:hypothetical protein [bacterium]